MLLEVTGPLPAGLVLWSAPRTGAMLTVVVKATYDLLPGVCSLRAEQEPLRGIEETAAGDPRRPVHAPSDLVPYKLRPEVMVAGSAFAPGGEPVPMFAARLTVAGVDKAVDVHAARTRTPDGRLLDGPPIASLPLAWELAAADASNPVGIRPELPGPAHAAGGGVALPQIVPSRAAAEPPFASAGLGPVPAHWPSRAARLGRSLAAPPRSWNGAALPDDLDPQFFQEAPADQHGTPIRPDEPLKLLCLHLRHSYLATRLPGVSPSVVVDRAGRAPEEVAMVGDTLWIDTDRALCTLTWRGRVRLSHAGEGGVVRVTAEGLSPAARGPREAVAAAPPSAGPDFRGTLEMSPSLVKSAAMPFVAGGPLPAPRLPPPAPPARARARVPPAGGQPASVPAGGARKPAWDPTATRSAIFPAPPVLPFRDAPEPAALPPSVPPPPPPRRASAEEVPLERCAAIAASIARRRGDEARILDESDLDAATWQEVKSRHEGEIAAQTRRGKMDLLRAYDRAYVEQIERERGPVTTSEYARLLVAAERGAQDDVLRELDLPRGVVLRLDRLWAERSARDEAASAQLAEAVRAERAR